MTRLRTMNGSSMGQGPKFSLISLSGPPGLALMETDPRQLSDVDAGIWTLAIIAKENPGIKWGDLLNKTQSMGGWWTNLKKSVGDYGKFVGNAISDSGDKFGEWGGDAIRLLTDKEVADGVSRYGQAYATGGQSEGVRGFLSSLGISDSGEGGGAIDKLKKQFTDILGKIGQSSKDQVNKAGMGDMNLSPMLLIGGLGFGLLLVLITKGRK